MRTIFLDRLLRRERVARYPAADDRPPTAFRGQPELLAERCRGHAACAAACPSGALQVERLAAGWDWQLDRARCVSCGLCVEACPEQAVVASGEFELAARDRPSLLSRIELRPARKARA